MVIFRLPYAISFMLRRRWDAAKWIQMNWIQFEIGSWSSQAGELSMKYVGQMEYFAINRFHTLSANEVYVEVHALFQLFCI